MSVTILNQPMNWKGSIGDEAVVWVDVSESGLTYTWYIKDPLDESFKLGLGCEAIYTSELTADNNGREIYCELSDGTNIVSTNIVTMETGVMDDLQTALCNLRKKKSKILTAISLAGVKTNQTDKLEDFPSLINVINRPIKESWDFRESDPLIGKERGFPLTATSASATTMYFDEDGLHFTDANKYGRIVLFNSNIWPLTGDYIYEFDISEMDLPEVPSKTIYLFSVWATTDIHRGLSYTLHGEHGEWRWRYRYDNITYNYYNTGILDNKLFNKSTCRIETFDGCTKASVYKDDKLLLDKFYYPGYSNTYMSPSLGYDAGNYNRGLVNTVVTGMRVELKTK